MQNEHLDSALEKIISDLTISINQTRDHIKHQLQYLERDFLDVDLHQDRNGRYILPDLYAAKANALAALANLRAFHSKT